MTAMTRMTGWLIRLAAVGLVAMAVIVIWQVFGRFVLDSSPSWTEQAALVLMIWYVMFASAAGVHEGFHIRIALLKGPRKTQAAAACGLFFATDEHG